MYPGNEYFMCKRVGAKMRVYEKILVRSSASCSKRMCLESGACVEREGKGVGLLGKNAFLTL